MLVFWVLLLLLGLFTFATVQQSVGSITRTPVWLLWLVMMMPALVLAGWALVQGPEKPLPLGVLLGLFVLCPLLYWGLVQWGRKPLGSGSPAAAPSQSLAESSAESPSPAAPSKPPLRPIDKEEESALQGCFPWSVYYLQNIEYLPQAMICRGQLRTSPTEAYETVKENVRRQFGDRFLVIFQEGMQGKPVFALVPNPQIQAQAQGKSKALTKPGLALGLLTITLLTTTSAGARLLGLTEAQQQADPSLIWQGLPYALALMVILGCHEMGHYLTARRYRMDATLPYFIPFPFFLGTFGAFIQLRSPVPHRRALFDVGIAGPLAGLVVTLPLLIWGLTQSTVVPIPESGSSLLSFEAVNPTASVLLALFIKLTLGAQVGLEQAVHLHPVAIAGCLGLVVTALNLMPVGQLDGGHIVHAMYGQRTGAIIGQVARLLVLMLAFVHSELLIWAILLFFIPVVDQPALNDISELDSRRDLLGLFALALLVLIVLPLPGPLARLLF
ncbi:site-2 protease family protein [Phormidium sp. FACHB-1136]|uniref:site-2 protease family protein n=1 Tax=Phormidium sp. FACHB-1136 TaxID=2692848 RepID=UPI0016828FE9|nr:site-2 protease family protein [Phormidium sp. FACHB-1136]MBD2428936.1 site-2 protease family protein [Phormidium sp. FACHB-1136]